MTELCIHHHLGLGDHFDCNGMVRFILNNHGYSKIYVFSKSNYFEMIEYMYRDTSDIEVIKIDKDLNELEQVQQFLNTKKDIQFLRIGFDQYPAGREVIDNKNCWEYFYEQVGIPYQVRTDYFYVKRDLDAESELLDTINPNREPFIFVHDDPERGYSIDASKLPEHYLMLKNDNSKNIFDFIKVLECADEIHCMESSYKSLIDFYAKTADLYYHDFRGHPLGTKTNREWTVVKYA